MSLGGFAERVDFVGSEPAPMIPESRDYHRNLKIPEFLNRQQCVPVFRYVFQVVSNPRRVKSPLRGSALDAVRLRVNSKQLNPFEDEKSPRQAPELVTRGGYPEIPGDLLP